VRHPLSCPSPSHSHSLYRRLREWNLSTCKLKDGRVAFLLVEGLFWLLKGRRSHVSFESKTRLSLQVSKSTTLVLWVFVTSCLPENAFNLPFRRQLHPLLPCVSSGMLPLA
jgi:hypothetical protein